MCTVRRSILLSAIASLSISASAHAQSASTTAGPPQVTTSAAGEVTLSPQRATVRIGVTSHGASAAEASTQGARVLERVLDTLVRSGLRRESLQTTAFGVGPNYDYAAGHKLIDYAGHAVIRVPLNDLTRVGKVIDMALAAGATEVGGIRFESDSADIARREALAHAFRQAHEDARAVAAAAGATLGRLLEIATRNDDYGGFAAAFAASAPGVDIQAPILPKDVVVRVFVELRWELVAPGP